MIKVYSIIACLFPFLSGKAQNMSAPYSVYGVGDIELREFNRLSGMGNAGLALRLKGSIVNKNPASVSGLDKGIFTFQVSANTKSVKYSGNPININNSKNQDVSIEKINLAIKVNSFWGSNIGFRKFSSVNYQFKSIRNMEGSAKTYDAVYSGDGGLNDFYWINSFTINKNFSAGIKTSFMSGSINQTEIFTDNTSNYELQSKVQDYFSKIRIDYGLIYSIKAGKKHEVSVAAKYSPKTKLAADRALTVIESGKTIVNDQFIKSDRFYLPQMLGAGIALRKKEGAVFAIDYETENWSALNIKSDGWSLRNSNRISVGVEIPKFVKAWNTSYEKNIFQFGAYVNNSYLSVRNNQIKSFGVTAGLGGTLSTNLLYSLAAEFGRRGTTRSDLIRENYAGLTITLSYREFINSKGRKFD